MIRTSIYASYSTNFRVTAGGHPDGPIESEASGARFLPHGGRVHRAQLCARSVHLRAAARPLRALLLLVQMVLLLLLLALSQIAAPGGRLGRLPARQRGRQNDDRFVRNCFLARSFFVASFLTLMTVSRVKGQLVYLSVTQRPYPLINFVFSECFTNSFLVLTRPCLSDSRY